MYVASELQRYKDTVRYGSLGTEVQGHHKEQLTQTLIVFLLKSHLFLLLQKLERRRPRWAPLSPPDWVQQSRVDVEKLQH